MKIVDCTLRDGGYYTNWDFPDSVVQTYLEAMEVLPIDVVELGYRSKALPGYYGKYFYCSLRTLERAKAILKTTQLAVMLNEKDTDSEVLLQLIEPIKHTIDMVRFAVDPERIEKVVPYIHILKEMDLQVAINLMYASKFADDPSKYEVIMEILKDADYVSLVDSYGGLLPSQTRSLARAAVKAAHQEIGFHGHNNLELAFANALAAEEEGIRWLDTTILGMGRGAGNLKTELALVDMSAKGFGEVDFDALSNALNAFEPLLHKYAWGTNLPYMVSGVSSLPQKDVMDWVSQRSYSMNNIVRAVAEKKLKPSVVQYEAKPLPDDFKQSSRVLLIGGGDSVLHHAEGIIDFIHRKKINVLVHASAKHANIFAGLDLEHVFSVVGSEGKRIEKSVKDLSSIKAFCIIPEKMVMTSYVPEELTQRVYTSQSIFDRYQDSHTALALDAVLKICPEVCYICGYDGYPDGVGQKEQSLFLENTYLFEAAKKQASFVTVTESKYTSLPQSSIYS